MHSGDRGASAVSGGLAPTQLMWLTVCVDSVTARRKWLAAVSTVLQSTSSSAAKIISMYLIAACTQLPTQYLDNDTGLPCVQLRRTPPRPLQRPTTVVCRLPCCGRRAAQASPGITGILMMAFSFRLAS